MKLFILLLTLVFNWNFIHAQNEIEKITINEREKNYISNNNLFTEIVQTPSTSFMGKVKYAFTYLYDTNKWVFFGLVSLIIMAVYRIIKFLFNRKQ